MKKLSLTVIAFLLWGGSVFANEKAILTLKQNHNISEKDVNQILKSSLVKKFKNVWTKKEKEMLKSMKMDSVSRSWIIEVSSYSDLLLLERKIHQLGLPLVIDDYEMPIKSLSSDFRSFQWGLKNSGKSQTLDLDPVQNFRVPGVAGEDIQRARILNTLLPMKKILVAVMDTGIDKTHPNLKSVIYRNEKECLQLEKFEQCLEKESDREVCEKRFMTSANPELDPDGNGYPLDCSGWSILGSVNQAGILGRPDFADDQGHGTHVAGIIGAQFSQTELGVEGVTSNVQILPIQVIGKKPSEPVKPLSVMPSAVEEKNLLPKKTLGDLMARGLLYAIRSKVQVINFSLGWPGTRDSELLKKMIGEAIKQGIIVVAAAGNDSTRALLRPCAYEGVICVGSHGPDGALSHFSNYGSGVDLAAPGLNVLSTFPMDQRPISFRETWGFEYLSGTSQAAPFVTGVVADMLSRGIPATEIYPRLILSARPAKPSLGIIEGAPHLDGKAIKAEDLIYKKFILSGNMDQQKALEVSSSPLILPVVKEKTALSFDAKSKSFTLPLKIKNFWQDQDWQNIKVQAQFRAPRKAVRPVVKVIKNIPTQGLFKNQDSIELSVEVEITDDLPENTRIPSDLELVVSIYIRNVLHRSWIQEYELLRPISADLKSPMMQVIPVQQFPKGRVEWNPIDEALDDQPTKKDYLLTLQDKNQWTVSLLTQDSSGNYITKGAEKIQIQGDSERIRTQILARIPMNNQTHYVLGLLNDQTDSDEDTPSSTDFFIFNQDFKLVESYSHKGDKAPMPYQIYWMQIGEDKKPCWVGYGKKTESKPSLIDKWENGEGHENAELRFYYLDKNNKLQSLESFDEYKIIDILEPTLQQKIKGTIPVILAKNLGSEAKPSYLYDFAKAEISNGEIKGLQTFKSFGSDYKYRNLIETRVDRILSLENNNEEYQGTYWFNENGKREQRVTYFYSQGNQYYDRVLKPMNPLFDSALLVRASFLGKKRAGSFVLTNSEIQYHDFVSGQMVTTSLERYTFYPDDFLTSIYLPITLEDSKNYSQKLPALFTTESSEIQRGVRIVVPVFARAMGKDSVSENLVELMTPAKLRFETKKNSGCKPLNTPVFLGAKGYAFDYFCGDKILRLPLKF